MFSILNTNLADIGFYINLESSTDREVLCQNQISEFNISNLNRFPALTDELRQYSCTKSHRAIFEYALANNINSVFVAEDDFEIYKRPYYLNNLYIDLSDFLHTYYNFIHNDNYDVLMFGCNPKKNIIPINGGFGINQSSTGAWSYIIKTRAMRYILDNYHYYRDYQAIDDILPSLNGKGFRTVVTIPNIIGHRNGISSTLQPHVGETYYSGWIDGNWHKHVYSRLQNYPNIQNIHDIQQELESKFLVEKKLTVVITGHCVENWLFYLRYLIKSLPESLYKCRFLISYDTCNNNDIFNIYRYFRDVKSEICPNISFVNHGLISSLSNVLNNIQTDYFLFLEHDWVFLNQTINYSELLQAFDKYKFINAVWFNKDDNQLRGFEICEDITGQTTPFELEFRVSEVPLTTTCRWSNNPAIFRTSKMKEWFDSKIKNQYTDIVHQGAANIEETMIPLYRNEIKQYGWDHIKDNWGTYLYGTPNHPAMVGHTDGTRRYQGHNKSIPEYAGENYILQNPLTDLD